MESKITTAKIKLIKMRMVVQLVVMITALLGAVDQSVAQSKLYLTNTLQQLFKN